MTIDPLTGSEIPAGVPKVQCPYGHVNRADSWSMGNRCHQPGCDYTGDPIGSGGGSGEGPMPLLNTLRWIVAGIAALIIGGFILGTLSSSGINNPTPGRPAVTQSGANVASISPGTTTQPPTATVRSNNPTPTRTVRPPATAHPPTPASPPTNIQTVTIGYSVHDIPIQAVQFGNGSRHIVFIGGLHAGFAPGTVNLANRAIEHFSSRLNEVPSSVTLHIISNASPDSPSAPGEKSGRLNANSVDLNRNWDCDWRSNAVWRRESISGGTAPFSEPETQVLRDYIMQLNPVAVVFWEAQATNGMSSPGGCGDRSLVSEPLARSYGRAAGYTVAEFESYALHGDVTNWLDSLRIPAIAVLLPSYTGSDWSNNLRGIKAVLNDYAR